MAVASRVTYIDYEGPAHPTLRRLTAALPLLRRFCDRFEADSTDRRNPRTHDYMVALVAETHGTEPAAHIRTIASVDDLDPRELESADHVVLLWRDGNGSGWKAVEKYVLGHTRRGASVTVLNGRRREFALTPGVWRGYLVRRFLEKTFLPEAALFVLFWIVTPWLALWDLVRARR
jgi:hypothetical protein